jgi:hypothetical protein
MRVAALVVVLSAAAAEPQIQPYSLIEVATQFDENGKPRPEYRMFRAMNSAGTTVTQDLSPEAGGLRQIITRNGLTNTLVDPAKRTAAAAIYNGSGHQPAMASCTDRFGRIQNISRTMLPAADRIAGLVVDRLTMQSLQWRTELWLAPALDCAIIREESYSSGKLTRRVEAVEVRLGEADPALFEVPFDYTYTEVSPFMKK